MARRFPSSWSIATAAVLLTGALLRTYQFALFDSLWADELHIALNVTKKSWRALLTSPLEYDQVAPAGFLAAVKLGVLLLGPNEAGLRVFPYLSSLASLFLFWRISVRCLKPIGQLAALSLFALSPALLWYARNAKQYSSDTAAVLVLIFLALHMQEGRGSVRRGVLVGILGGLTIVFSQPAVLVAAALTAVLLVQRWRAGENLGPIAPIGAGWFVAAAIVAVTSLLVTSSTTRVLMRDAWGGFFFPTPWESWKAFFWLPRRLLNFTGFLVGLFRPDEALEIVVAGVYSVLAVMGAAYLTRQSPRVAVFLLVPPVVAVVASMFNLLPLGGRVSLYVGPSLLIFAAGGIEWVQGRLPVALRPWSYCFVILLSIAPAFTLHHRLFVLNHRMPARPILEEVRSQWRAGDVLYVQGGAKKAMSFYGDPIGLQPWILGGNYGTDGRAYLREVDALRGLPRVWFFFNNSPSCVQLTIQSYLNAIGTELARLPDPYGNKGRNEATAYLYALDDPLRGARFTADTYLIPECINTRKRRPRVTISGDEAESDRPQEARRIPARAR